MPPKRKRAAAADVQVVAQQDVQVTVQEETTTPTRRSSRKTKSIKAATDRGWDSYGTSSPLSTPPSSPLAEPASPAKSPRKRRKKGEPVVYHIPPITDFKTTDFQGRLGYACLNTVLRTQDPPVFCSRTCRLATLREKGLDYAKALGLQNVRDLKTMIAWNEENNIRFMRVSSEMFPFASHKEWGYDLAYAKAELAEAGALAKKLGHRLTAHPGQFTQLASPKDAVIEASIRELEYHCQMMRYMGLGKDSVIVLHMGGVYGDKPAALARFRDTYTARLTAEMRARLVLENDELCYSADDLLPLCEALDIPVVLDYHHNYINPSALPLPELVRRINGTWRRKGIRVKQHLSEPRPGLWYNDWTAPAAASVEGAASAPAPAAPDTATAAAAAAPAAPAKRPTATALRAHAARCSALPAELALMDAPGADTRARAPGGGGDLMVEAKDKEQAVFQLYRTYRLFDVEHKNLRPEGGAAAGAGSGAGGGDGDGEEPDREGGGQAPKKRGRKKGAESAVEGLVNQEEVPVPVDGAPVAEVEAEEHPEAAEGLVRETGKKRRARNAKQV